MLLLYNFFLKKKARFNNYFEKKNNNLTQINAIFHNFESKRKN